MKTENLTILVMIAVLAIVVAGVHMARGTMPGQGFYELKPDGNKISHDLQAAKKRIEAIEKHETMTDAEKQTAKSRVIFSWPRTIGIWIAAFFTLAMLSFLYKDNPIYKIAEHAFVGTSAAYWMTVAYWTTVVPNLLGKLFPRWVKFNMMPGTDVDSLTEELAATAWLQGIIDYDAAGGDGLTASALQLMNIWYWPPMILGIMLLWRLAPKGAWIARWPLAFILGSTAGVRLTGFLESDFIKQIQSTIIPLIEYQYDPATGALNFGQTFYASMNNILIVLGVMCGLVYFFFSLEHKGFVGRVSRVGVWVLMVTFGAGFGYTVMGRIALLVGRFEFLVIDWLNIVDR